MNDVMENIDNALTKMSEEINQIIDLLVEKIDQLLRSTVFKVLSIVFAMIKTFIQLLNLASEYREVTSSDA